ncbi:TMEM175 family protein [Companilactobacillus kimchiensis]|uniref:Ferrochelatase n=1 Tax=Companilactobacillus kimchiensis TaxID=993692 RepID=A0A0R2LAW6_9LACO|nr:TMEM175 family protein [Companilactobacillus kimchiensis]KRN98859.1 ferrochelatase [Companilactobacillus kimchiensis]
MNNERLTAFEDAILAIIMTILVLDLSKPKEVSWAGLWDLRISFFAYALSFFWIGLMWMSHHNNWRLVHIIDMKTILLTLVLLFFASLFPYTTSLVSENFNNSTAQVFYGLIIIAISLLNVALSQNLGRLNPKANFGLLYKTPNRVVFLDLGIKFIGLVLAITVYPAAMIYSIFIASVVLGFNFSKE